jgi:hypothetical protein
MTLNLLRRPAGSRSGWRAGAAAVALVLLGLAGCGDPDGGGGGGGYLVQHQADARK